ncbi:MAG TPA: DUF1028 domain-containing protein [Gemmataceae bacterium]|nr:DUF1028 domain-containing protein [Gemmataceae bacterium]
MRQLFICTVLVAELAGMSGFSQSIIASSNDEVIHLQGAKVFSGKSAAPRQKNTWANTYSIVPFDPDHKEWGVAVASRALACGSIVPWAKAGVGAVATQSYANVAYGPRGLELLAEGKTPEQVLEKLTGEDPGKDLRQVGIVDARGNGAHFTGPKCQAWAGGKSGKHYTCQGNILAGEEVVNEMAKAFEETTGPLAWRMMAALEAGEKAGGDKRGKQSAGILVVRDKGGPNGLNDRMIDLRVDDHENPVQELARILGKRVRRPER